MKTILKTILIVTLLPAGYLIGGVYPWPRYIFGASIEITKNIELPKDNPFSEQDNFSPAFVGVIGKGSLCWQVMRKGNVVYISCSTTVKGDAIKYTDRS